MKFSHFTDSRTTDADEDRDRLAAKGYRQQAEKIASAQLDGVFAEDKSKPKIVCETSASDNQQRKKVAIKAKAMLLLQHANNFAAVQSTQAMQAGVEDVSAISKWTVSLSRNAARGRNNYVQVQAADKRKLV
ncbi:unnamed protein product [Ceratitis capitata]|uniref:(Mediterranean fruit fly) hypothetical protein n=1 Tax=Ceratitis capitata TaxID=7213 RepID=A0A811U951_CERCA|nr:unnamed protein product [Ceratitis capitata]